MRTYRIKRQHKIRNPQRREENTKQKQNKAILVMIEGIMRHTSIVTKKG